MLLYRLFREPSLSWLWIPLLVLILVVSYVTAADSQTDAIGSVSWVMVSVVGIVGVRMVSSLRGLPSMVIVVLATSALSIWMRNSEFPLHR